MSLLTDIQADTSNILADWQTSLVFQRKTFLASSAGEEVGVWATSWATSGDVQWRTNRKRGDVRTGGFEYSPEADVFLRVGANVAEGDRTSIEGFTMYVQEVKRDPDKLQIIVSRRTRDATT